MTHREQVPGLNILLVLIYNFLIYGPQRQKNCPHAGDEVSETAKAVAGGESTGGERTVAKSEAI
jgi:hypothetical protein